MSSELFYLISLPTSVISRGDPEEELEKWYKESLALPSSNIKSFSIPQFKIGTLDSLVQLSEELAKIDGQFSGILSKISDIISTLYDGNIAQVNASKRVEDRSAVEYVKSFSWSTNKYRLDKSIPELVDLLTKVCILNAII